VVLGAHTLWYNQEMVDKSRIDITSPRHGTTMAHEIVSIQIISARGMLS
jgi:hypothetical protein